MECLLPLEVKHENLDVSIKVDPTENQNNMKVEKHQSNKHELKHSLVVENVNDTKLFSCKFCQRTFKSRNSLEGHERVHTGERPFSCKYCKHTFTLQSTLKNHEKSHFRKSFSCKNCQKVFHSYTDKKEHEKVHKEKKPYTCKICNKRYGRLDTLKDHERYHSGKTLSCPKCPKKFTMEHLLKKHVCAKNSFWCEICNKGRDKFM